MMNLCEDFNETKQKKNVILTFASSDPSWKKFQHSNNYSEIKFH